MKKHIKFFYSALILFVISSVLLVFSLIYQPSSPTALQSGKNEKSNIGTAAVKSIQVNVPGKSYVIEHQNNKYLIDGKEETFWNQNEIKKCFEWFNSSTAEMVSEYAKDMEQYGLSGNSITIDVEWEKGIKSFVIGNAVQNNGYYAAEKGENTVFIFDFNTIEKLLAGKEEFVSKTITATADGKAMLPQRVQFSEAGYTENLVLEKKELSQYEKQYGLYNYIIISHNNAQADSEKTVNMLASLTQIIADSVEAVYPSQEQIINCGLEKGKYTLVTVTVEDTVRVSTTVNLKISDLINGNIYIIKDEMPVIYKVSKEKLPWLNVQYSNIVSKLIFVPNIDDVLKIVINDSIIFDIENNGTSTDIKVNGKKTDTALFGKFYESLISLTGEITNQNNIQEGDIILKAEYTLRDGTTKDITVISGKSTEAYVSINGIISYVTQAKYARTILANAKAPIENKEITPLY